MPGMELTSLLSPALAGKFFTTSAAWEATQRLKKPQESVGVDRAEASLCPHWTNSLVDPEGAEIQPPAKVNGKDSSTTLKPWSEPEGWWCPRRRLKGSPLFRPEGRDGP